MGKAYHTKVIVSGQYVEKIDYEKPVFVGYSGRGRKKKSNNDNKEKDIDKTEENKRRSIRRTRAEFGRLVNSNFQLTKFFTLTFDPKKQPDVNP